MSKWAKQRFADLPICRFAHLSVILLGFALRLYRLGAQSLWYDEGVSVYLAARPLAEITTHTARDIHPPLYYYLLHFAVKLWGTSEFAAAFHSLVWGTLLIALGYRVAQYIYGRPVAPFAALLLAISPFNIWYSQEVRMYTLGAFWGLGTLYFLLRTFRGDKLLRYLLGYVCAAALGMYTLYYFAFLLIFEALVMLTWWFIRQRDLRTATRYVLAQLAVVVLYAPWIPSAYRQATDPPVPPWRGFTPLKDVVIQSWNALAFGQSVEPRTIWGALVVVGIIYLFGLGYSAGKKKGAARCAPTEADTRPLPFVLLGYTFVPLVIIYLLSLWMPLFHVRYVFTYSAPFYILLAAGLRQMGIRANWQTFVSGIIILGVSTYSLYNFHFNPRYTSDDHRTAVRYLADRWRPGDAILLHAGYIYTIFSYYYPAPLAWRGRLVDYVPSAQRNGAVTLQTGSVRGATSLGWGDPEADFYPTTEEETAAALERVFAAHERVWVYRCYDTVVDAEGFVNNWLATNMRLFDDTAYAGESYLRVQGYMRDEGSREEIARALHRDFGGKLNLLGSGALPDTTRAGETLHINLFWQATQRLSENYRVLVELYDSTDALYAYTDEMPLGNVHYTSRWGIGEIMREPVRLNLPAALPPADYSLEVTVYDAQGHALAVDGAARVIIANLRMSE